MILSLILGKAWWKSKCVSAVQTRRIAQYFIAYLQSLKGRVI